MLRVLNLYAGIGGNRRLWTAVKVTAVEYDPVIAGIYGDHFPDDELVVGDAHAYLLEHFAEFDFIWSSPPCQSHSSFRQNICVRYRGTKATYPDMKLYQEILFLKHNAGCLWAVENVKPYYTPLIPARQLQRHLFWSNFEIPFIKIETDLIRKAQIKELQISSGFDLSKYRLKNKRQVLRNCIRPELGRHVLDCAKKAWMNA